MCDRPPLQFLSYPSALRRDEDPRLQGGWKINSRLTTHPHTRRPTQLPAGQYPEPTYLPSTIRYQPSKMGQTSSTLKDRLHPGTPSSPTPQTLCPTCLSLLGSLSLPSPPITLPLTSTHAPLTPSHAPAGALLLPALGTRRQILRRATCPLCRPFLSLVDIMPPSSSSSPDPNEPLELRVYPFSLSWPVYAHAFAQHQVVVGGQKGMRDGVLFACPRKGKTPTNYEVRKALEGRVGGAGLAVLASSGGGGGAPADGREEHGEGVVAPVRGQRFPVERARGWVRECLEGHGELCGDGGKGGEGRVRVTGMKVIDCETLEILKKGDDMEWVALSYVWRLAVENVPASSLVDKLPTGLRLPDMIPGLIVDAMKVAKGLGYRYIWVDRYCIDQDNLAEKQEQIAQMDLIYRGAELTIIAAGDYNGLGGVGEDPATQRKPLGAVSFGPSMTLYETDPSPIAEVKRSAWFTRGWTFQEAVLSRRRLFFTPSQALFECATGTRCEMGALGERTQNVVAYMTAFSLEALVYPEIPRLAQLIGSATATNLPPDLKDAKGIPLDEYLEEASAMMLIYRGKQLTVESDAVDAFSGVLKVFEETPYQISHLQGIPFPQRNARDDGIDLEMLQQRAFGLGLVWSDQGVRRPDFPSWTWAGWTATKSRAGRAIGKALGRFEGNFTSFIDVLSVACKCGQTHVPLGSAAGAQRGDHKPWTLEIGGKMVPPGMLALRQHGNGSSFLETRGPGPDGLVYSSEEVHFGTKTSPEDLLKGFSDGSLVGLALGEETAAVNRSLYVLVIEVKGRKVGRTVGERKDLILFAASKMFTQEVPLFEEASGLQAVRVAIS